MYRPCPICDSTRANVLHSQKRVQLEGALFPEENDIVACEGCGFVYVDSDLSQDRCDEHYRRYSSYDNANISTSSTDAPTDAERERFRFGLDEICATTRKNAVVLDIGCASGAFLQLLAERGFSNLHGMDMSPACLRRVEAKGMTARPGSVTAPFESPERFDYITLFQSLEHVYDLRAAVRSTHAMLRCGGRLLVEVPDAMRYDELFSKTWFYQEHINHFDENALVNLFAAAFRPVKTYCAAAHDGILHARIPTLGIVFEAVEHGKTPAPRNDRTCERHVERYVAMLREAMRPVEELLRRLARTREPLAVWGAGSFFGELLALTALGECDIVLLVDRDVHKHGREVRGRRVAPPESLYGYHGALLVASEESKGSILRDIADMGLKNTVYTV